MSTKNFLICRKSIVIPLIVGLVRDRYNYAIALHCLNIMSFMAATAWILEALIRRYLQKPSTLSDEPR